MNFRQTIQLKESGSKIQIMRTGSFSSKRYGNFKITQDTYKEILRNFEGAGRIPLDFNHGSGETDPEKAKAAGWIQELFVKGDKLMAKVEFTPAAREYVANSEYRFISAEFVFGWIDPADPDKRERGAKLLAAALTNRPFIRGMRAVTLSEQALSEKMEAISKAFYQSFPENEVFQYSIEVAEEDHVVMRREGAGRTQYFQVPFSATDGVITFKRAASGWTEMRKGFEIVSKKNGKRTRPLLDKKKRRKKVTTKKVKCADHFRQVRRELAAELYAANPDRYKFASDALNDVRVPGLSVACRKGRVPTDLLLENVKLCLYHLALERGEHPGEQELLRLCGRFDELEGIVRGIDLELAVHRLNRG